jgi:NAD dependent epimerase/dehydratase
MTTQHWAGKTVLVTGAGGFIASHLTEALMAAGAHVKALVKYNSAAHWGHLEPLAANPPEGLTVLLGDVTDPQFMHRAVAGCDVVFHLAALIGIPYSYVAPHHYVAVNVQGTLNVLEACLRQPGTPPRLIHTSTSEAYGTARYTPIDEAHPLQGQSPYSASKIGADKLAESYHLSFDLPVTTVRPFNTYGPRQSARAFIPTVITQALTQPVIKVGSLSPQRDLNYVSDTVAGFMAAAGASATIGRVVNLGTGDTHTMGHVLNLILSHLGTPDLPVEVENARIRPDNSEVLLLQADATLAHELMGWAPQVSLDQGLALTVAAIKQSLDRYKPLSYAV